MHKGLALGEEADYEALNCLQALNLIRSTKLHLSTEPTFLPKAFYGLGFCSLILSSASISLVVANFYHTFEHLNALILCQRMLSEY